MALTPTYQLITDMIRVCPEEYIKNITCISLDFSMYSDSQKFVITICYRRDSVLHYDYIREIGRICWNSVNTAGRLLPFFHNIANTHLTGSPKRAYHFTWTGESVNLRPFEDFLLTEENLDE